ncbi:MAG: DUF1800 domain-containing protein [Actinomycetota bacterium]|nr:DUF1800 domain-containing protein [Actinomycetota bacterium]
MHPDWNSDVWRPGDPGRPEEDGSLAEPWSWVEGTHLQAHRKKVRPRELLGVLIAPSLFTFPAIHDLAWCWRNHYDAMLRRKALGNFDDLLVSAALHPSMLLYLSNYESTKDAPNVLDNQQACGRTGGRPQGP